VPTLFPYQFSGIDLSLNGVSYPNNSIVNIIEIGTGSAALNCTTTLPWCCYSSSGGGNGWFFPNGSEVTNNASLSYYRTRATNPGALLLNHNPEGTKTGIFRCDIPVASDATQSLYVGIYTSTTGENLALQTRTIQFKCLWGEKGGGRRRGEEGERGRGGERRVGD